MANFGWAPKNFGSRTAYGLSPPPILGHGPPMTVLCSYKVAYGGAPQTGQISGLPEDALEGYHNDGRKNAL